MPPSFFGFVRHAGNFLSTFPVPICTYQATPTEVPRKLESSGTSTNASRYGRPNALRTLLQLRLCPKD